MRCVGVRVDSSQNSVVPRSPLNPPTHNIILGDTTQQDVVQRLRRAHSGELHLVYDHCRSHAALSRKNALLLTLLEHISVAASKARGTHIQKSPLSSLCMPVPGGVVTLTP